MSKHNFIKLMLYIMFIVYILTTATAGTEIISETDKTVKYDMFIKT